MMIFFQTLNLGKYNSENDYVFRNIFGLYIEQIKKNQSLIYTKTFNILSRLISCFCRFSQCLEISVIILKKVFITAIFAKT